MCLNKLYADITVLVGTEFPLPRFFVAVDTVCRGWPRRQHAVRTKRKAPTLRSGAPPRAAKRRGGISGE